MKIQPPPVGLSVLGVLAYSILPLVVLSLALVLACWTYHQRKAPYGHVDIGQVKSTTSPHLTAMKERRF